jgi:CRP/FNR family cyclic AMP-dependent transcriptional regulator
MIFHNPIVSKRFRKFMSPRTVINAAFLRTISLLEGFSEDGFNIILDSLTIIRYQRQSVIYFQDEITRGAFLVKKGLVKTTKLLHTGEECTLELFFPGEAFGLRAFFGPGKQPSNALTIDPSSLFFLPYKILDSLGPDLLTLRTNIFHIMDERLRKLEDRFSDLAYRSLNERLAALLVKLISRNALETNKKPVLPLSQGEIASLVGSTRESVSTVLNHFKRKGLLSLKRRKIQVEDVNALRKTAGLRNNVKFTRR